MPPIRTKIDKLRILQVFNQYLERGGEEVWVDTVSGFSGPEMEISNLRFRSREWTRKEAPIRLIQAKQVWDNPGSRLRLQESVRQNSPDVLLYHNLIPVASLGLYQEAEFLGLPVVQYIHNFRPFSPSGTMWVGNKVNPAALSGNMWPEILSRSWEKSFLKTMLVASYQKRLLTNGHLNSVKRWIAISEFMRECFISAGIPEDRVVTLRHCWNAQATPDPSRMSGHYLFLGRLVPEKGIFTLLEAWKILEGRLGKACPRLVIAGSGPAEAKVHTMINRMRQVVCVGFIEGKTKHDLLHGCRALIAPSIWWEPLGLIVYEAYDFARPVIVAESGGLRETVVTDITGFTHAPGCPNELADKVEMMEQAGVDGRISMGMAGREWLLKNASRDEWLERFKQIMTDAAEGKNTNC